MGLLSGNTISRIFGKVFSDIFEEGMLIQIEKQRQPNGTLRDEIVASYPVKVQFDLVTKEMKATEGYAVTDMRAIILRDGLPLSWITPDHRLQGQGQEWLLHNVTTDPARSHFEARAALRKGTA